MRDASEIREQMENGGGLLKLELKEINMYGLEWNGEVTYHEYKWSKLTNE